MISLKSVYGDKIFDRKAGYRGTRYFSIVAHFLIDVAVSVAIVKLFNLTSRYAIIWIYCVIQAYRIVKYMLYWFLDFLNYRLSTRKALASEIRHYLRVLDVPGDRGEICTYDEFLLEAAFNRNMPENLRILAAINYGIVVDAMSVAPRFDSRCWNVYCDVAPDFFSRKEEHDG